MLIFPRFCNRRRPRSKVFLRHKNPIATAFQFASHNLTVTGKLPKFRDEGYAHKQGDPCTQVRTHDDGIRFHKWPKPAPRHWGLVQTDTYLVNIVHMITVSAEVHELGGGGLAPSFTFMLRQPAPAIDSLPPCDMSACCRPHG